MGLRLIDACYGFCVIWENAEALLYSSVPTARLQLALFIVFYVCVTWLYSIFYHYHCLYITSYYCTIITTIFLFADVHQYIYTMQCNFTRRCNCRSEQLLLRDQITHSNAQLAAYFTKPKMLQTTDLSSARRTVLCLHSTYHIGWQRLCASDFIPFALHEQSSAFQTFFPLSCTSNLLPLCEDRTRVHISNLWQRDHECLATLRWCVNDLYCNTHSEQRLPEMPPQALRKSPASSSLSAQGEGEWSEASPPIIPSYIAGS